MKVDVHFEIGGKTIHETVVAPNSEVLLSEAKSRVMKELGWKGLFLAPLSPLGFAQEAVRRYNAHFQTEHPVPQNPDQFLQFGIETGSLTVLEW